MLSTAHSLLVAFFTPLMAWTWLRLGRLRLGPAVKLLSGIGFLAAGLLAVVPFSGSTGPTNSLVLMLVVAAAMSLGEAIIAPTALAITSAMAPRLASAQMTALYFLSMAAGSTLSGRFAKLYSPDHEAVYFAGIGLGGVVVCVLLCLVHRALTAHALPA